MDHVNGIVRYCKRITSLQLLMKHFSVGSNEKNVMAKDWSIARGGGGEVGKVRLVACLGVACWPVLELCGHYVCGLIFCCVVFFFYQMGEISSLGNLMQVGKV